VVDWQVTRDGSPAGSIYAIAGSPWLRCNAAVLPSPSLAGNARQAPRWARVR
jgi:hypothetical protein